MTVSLAEQIAAEKERLYKQSNEKRLAAKAKRKQSRKGYKRPDRAVVWLCSLKAKRAALSLSRKDLTKATGLSIRLITECENGYDVKLKHARTLAAMFNTTVDEMWTTLPAQDVK